MSYLKEKTIEQSRSTICRTRKITKNGIKQENQEKLEIQFICNRFGDHWCCVQTVHDVMGQEVLEDGEGGWHHDAFVQAIHR